MPANAKRKEKRKRRFAKVKHWKLTYPTDNVEVLEHRFDEQTNTVYRVTFYRSDNL